MLKQLKLKLVLTMQTNALNVHIELDVFILFGYYRRSIEKVKRRI